MTSVEPDSIHEPLWVNGIRKGVHAKTKILIQPMPRVKTSDCIFNQIECIVPSNEETLMSTSTVEADLTYLPNLNLGAAGSMGCVQLTAQGAAAKAIHRILQGGHP